MIANEPEGEGSAVAVERLLEVAGIAGMVDPAALRVYLDEVAAAARELGEDGSVEIPHRFDPDPAASR